MSCYDIWLVLALAVMAVLALIESRLSRLEAELRQAEADLAQARQRQRLTKWNYHAWVDPPPVWRPTEQFTPPPSTPGVRDQEESRRQARIEARDRDPVGHFYRWLRSN